MKAIMMSVSPKNCEKVINGDCTILVKKSIPKIEEPIKCYLYCTEKGYDKTFGVKKIGVTKIVTLKTIQSVGSIILK